VVFSCRPNDLNGLVAAAGVVGCAVREEPVDDETDNGEDEDEETPEELVAGRAVRLENLDPDNDVENQDNKTDDAAASAILPGVGSRLGVNRRGKGKGGQPELEEERQSRGEHDCGCLYCALFDELC
jgi:hypothetical protein